MEDIGRIKGGILKDQHVPSLPNMPGDGGSKEFHIVRFLEQVGPNVASYRAVPKDVESNVAGSRDSFMIRGKGKVAVALFIYIVQRVKGRKLLGGSLGSIRVSKASSLEL
ncbi:hypothetical protein V6N12_049853 [Hibiscus sabdariffa]|uniref:Uncharacterized protein n=1 Tax=Hibiscus sabdariffa TaxID=183260 RepID=A0ABR2GAQ6_9ROSI